MDVYLEELDITKQELTFPKNFLKKWPTFLNSVVKSGLNWAEYIDGSNYHLTSQFYTDEKYCAYADWLIENPDVKNEDLFRDIAKFGSVFHVKRYSISNNEYRNIFVCKSLECDNLPVYEEIQRNNEFPFLVIQSHFLSAMDSHSRSCADYLLKLILKFEPVPLKISVWYSLQTFGDFSVAIALKDFLELTPRTIDCENFADIYAGSPEDVKNALSGGCTAYDMSAAISRIPFDESVGEFVLAKLDRMQKCGGTHEGYFDKLLEIVLLSSRHPGQTERILHFLLVDGCDLFARGKTSFDLSLVTARTMEAMTKTSHLLDPKKFFMSSSDVMNCVLSKENRDILIKFLVTFGGNLTLDCSTYLFIALGSSLSRWGRENGYLWKLDSKKNAMSNASRSGNSYLMALMLKDKVGCKSKIRKEDFAQPRVHCACRAMIRACVGALKVLLVELFQQEI